MDTLDRRTHEAAGLQCNKCADGKPDEVDGFAVCNSNNLISQEFEICVTCNERIYIKPVEADNANTACFRRYIQYTALVRCTGGAVKVDNPWPM